MEIPAGVQRWLTGRQSDPSVRFRYWTEVAGRAPGDRVVEAAHRQIGKVGWAATLLERQLAGGQFVTPGSSGRELYWPKYVSTNWVAIVVGDLGMTRKDPRIRRIAELIFSRWGRGKETIFGRGGEVCITGNAVRTLVRFGYLDHPVVQRSIDWLVKTQIADGGWHCFSKKRGTLDGWEALAAFAEIPESERDARLRRSIERGAEFFLQRRLMNEGRQRYEPWFRIHYPNHYFYDVLVGLRTLTRLGYGGDKRMAPALGWLRRKRSRQGTWALDAVLPDIDSKGAGFQYTRVVYPMMLEQLRDPSRWATVEALSILRRVENSAGARR